jgi:TIR domain
MSEYDVFLSHFSGDAALAGALHRALTAAGMSVWYDGAEIKLGDSILAKMREGLQRSRYGLILFTPGFLSTSTGFRWAEVEAYLGEQLSSGRTHILPLVAGVEHQDYNQKMPLLRARRYERVTLNNSGRASKAELDRVAQVISEVATLRTLVRLVGRDELNSAIGGLEDRLTNIRERLMVSGNDCKAIVESKSGFLTKALDRGVKIRILCVDPKSAHAVETLVMIDPRFDDATDFTLSMQAVERVLTKLRSTYPNLFEFRYMPIAPSVGIYISDPGLPTAVIKVELYTPKPWKPIDTRPHILLKHDGAWRDYFLSAWENYWNMSRVPA